MTLQIHLKSTERQFPLLASDMSHVFHVSHFEMAQEATHVPCQLNDPQLNDDRFLERNYQTIHMT